MKTRTVRKQLPIGISDYQRLVEEDYYYVDKTDFIRQVIEEGSVITLLPRPRRFGKTLNLSMLRYFFEMTEGNVYRPLFTGKSIEGWADFDTYQGKFPVVFVTLKDCKGDTLESSLAQLAFVLKSEFERHVYLLDDHLADDDRRQYNDLLNRRASAEEMQNSLGLLSRLLKAHWGAPAIVLLDEYDTPVHVAFDKGYYDQMIGFMRNFMSTVFKDNTDIFRGVITGILRVSKESIFSGLNNITVFSILNHPMCTAFGFTQDEIDCMLDNYELNARKEEIRQWYNGYLFGGETIYNPWSLLNFVMYGGEAAPYWVNTGSDVLLRHLVAEGPLQVRQGIEALIQGGTVKSVINDKLAFPDLLSEASNIWSFMLFSGYLNAFDGHLTEDDLAAYTLCVPNREVRTVFRTIVRNWINDGPVKNDRLELMLQALAENNMPIFQRLLNDFVVNTLSYYDTSGRDPEKVYQAFLLGLLVSSGAYEVSSNRESGLGRYDILLRPRDLTKRGIVMELKLYDAMFDTSVDAVLDAALGQIEDKQYAAVLRAAGVKEVLKMAITFDGKRVWVKTAEEK